MIKKTKKLLSPSEELFAMQLKVYGIKNFIREHKFHPVRKWRFDFANLELMIAVEIEGGIFNNGRHSRGSGFTADCYKYAEATVLQWKILRFTSEMVKNGDAIKILSKIIGS